MAGQAITKLSLAGALVAVVLLLLPATAGAHVVVRPAETKTADYQIFTVSVPNEKDQPTVRVKVLIPDGVEHVTPTQKPGWQINIDKTGDGEYANVTAVTWSGGAIEAGLRDDFTFSAKMPAQPAELQWKAYQTYADGRTVAWDREAQDRQGHSDDNTGPFSVTQVTDDGSADATLQDTTQTANKADKTAKRALYVAATALAVSLLAVFITIRKRAA